MLVFMFTVSCVSPLEAIVIMSSAGKHAVSTNKTKLNKVYNILDPHQTFYKSFGLPWQIYLVRKFCA